jgi:single-stranded DNA-specific DHH superfamily exonuclease
MADDLILDWRNKRIAVTHHNDGDGICSAAIFALTLKKFGNFPVMIHSPERVDFDDETRAMIKDSGAEFLAILDIPIERLTNPNFPCLVIDHHPHTEKIEISGTVIHNPKNCASFLTYEFCSKITDIKDLAWIAAIGCLSDKDEDGFEKIFKIVSEENKELDRKTLHNMMGFISSSKVLGSAGIACGVNSLIEAATMGIETSVLGSTPNSQKLQYLRAMSRRERDYWLLYHKDFAKIWDKMIYYKIDSDLPVQSYLAGTLSNFYPDKVCFVTNKNYADKFMTIEARTKLNTMNLGQLMRHTAEMFGGNGGGLEYAAGAKIPVEKENEFIEQLKEHLKDV